MNLALAVVGTPLFHSNLGVPSSPRTETRGSCCSAKQGAPPTPFPFLPSLYEVFGIPWAKQLDAPYPSSPWDLSGG